MQHKQQYTHHSHSNHRIHIGYHNNLTDIPYTTTCLHTQDNDIDPAVNVRDILSYCRLTSTESKTNSRSLSLLFRTHIQISSQFRKPSSPLKQTHPKYITSPPCVPIGCTKQEMGSLH